MTDQGAVETKEVGGCKLGPEDRALAFTGLDGLEVCVGKR